MLCVVIGGGAAGFFAAITCAEANPEARVIILERGREVLGKVKVSGGGRCNVTHACFDPRELVKFYPRGAKALLGPFHRFGPAQTVDWFESRGVRLKTEADGRMFPTTDKSQTIIDCLVNAARSAGVDIRTSSRVEQLYPPQVGGQPWKIMLGAGEALYADKIMIATGSSQPVWDILQHLGHHIVAPVPSLFTFNIRDPRLEGIPGISVPDSHLRIPGKGLEASGPLLITHWGLSGPAVLRLSAWGARALHDCQYRFDLHVNWTGEKNCMSTLEATKAGHGRKALGKHCPYPIPNRLWMRLLEAAGQRAERNWADLGKGDLQKLAAQLSDGCYAVDGKSTFKEEFVTAGGVDLDDVDFRRFESRIFHGLHLAGEVLDIDALTGGFNFQAAWTGGWLAGLAMGETAP